MRVHESFDVSGQKQLNTVKGYILMHAALFEKNRQEVGALFSKEVLEKLIEINSFASHSYTHLVESARAYTECVIALRGSNQKGISFDEQEQLQEAQTCAHDAFITAFEEFVGVIYTHKDSQDIVPYFQKLNEFLEEKDIEIVPPEKEGDRLVLNNFSRIRSSQIALFVTYDYMKE